MFSLQKLLGKEDKFFTLLEASAEEARASVQALVELSQDLEKPVATEEFSYKRKKDKQITEQISSAVYHGRHRRGPLRLPPTLAFFPSDASAVGRPEPGYRPVD